MKLRNRVTVLIVLLAVPLLPLIAQDSQEQEELPVQQKVYRSIGDQSFSFAAGLFIPLFSHAPSGDIVQLQDHLSLGGSGHLEWSGYLTPQMTLGGQLAGMFGFSVNQRLLTMIQVHLKYTYIFNLDPITIPLSIAAGVSFNNLDDIFQITPAVKPGVGANWNINSNWAVGFLVNYWWVPEFHTNQLKPQSRMGNFIETTVSAVYHF